MEITKKIDGLSKYRRGLIFGFSGIILGFLPWYLFSLLMKDGFFLNMGIKYGLIGLLAGLVGGIFYKKYRKIPLILMLIVFGVLVFLILKYYSLALFFYLTTGPDL